MAARDYRGRRAATIENADVRVTVLEEGGHIAEMLDKRSGINPLWTPPWPSIEPSTYAPSTHPDYGTSSEAALLAGLMGHNLCVDIFGGPSEEEAAAGLTPHGEASVVRYDIDVDRGSHSIAMHALLPLAQLQIDRRLVLRGRRAHDPRSRRESHRVRSADRLDPARHARPAVSSEGRHGVSRVRDAVEGLRTGVRRARRPGRRSRLRLAVGAAGGRRHQRPAPTTPMRRTRMRTPRT